MTNLNSSTYRVVSNLTLRGLIAHQYGERFDGADASWDFFFEDVYVGTFHAPSLTFLDGLTTQDCRHVADAVAIIRKAVAAK